MSTMTLSTYGSEVSVNQGFLANPSTITLNRRGRLARTFVVLSLSRYRPWFSSQRKGWGGHRYLPSSARILHNRHCGPWRYRLVPGQPPCWRAGCALARL